MYDGHQHIFFESNNDIQQTPPQEIFPFARSVFFFQWVDVRVLLTVGSDMFTDDTEFDDEPCVVPNVCVAINELTSSRLSVADARDPGAGASISVTIFLHLGVT